MHPRILCVDDDPRIRQTLPPVLQTRGYDVTVASTVAEALAAIAAKPFDALIADLNIGEPGDGFTVVSAMRRTHPRCVNFILTGYPALEAALDAIRNQVDRFLVKPADVGQLLGTIEQGLREHPSHQPSVPKRLSQVLRDSACEIANLTLARMKDSPELRELSLSDKDRVSLIPEIVQNLAALIEKPGTESEQALASMAVEQALIRYNQGYTAPMLMENVRFVGDSIAEVVRENMLSMDMSNLWTDIQRLNDWGTVHVKELLKAFYSAEERVA